MSKLQSTSSELTQAAAVGTPGYMSPEQARGQPATTLVDVFGLAAVVYRCLTGAAPFPGASVPQVLCLVAYVQPQCPSTLADLPDDIDLVLAIAMAKRTTDRYQTIGELVAAFTEAAYGNLTAEHRARGHAAIARHGWGCERPLA